jgi:hypothetical protein
MGQMLFLLFHPKKRTFVVFFYLLTSNGIRALCAAALGRFSLPEPRPSLIHRWNATTWRVVFLP